MSPCLHASIPFLFLCTYTFLRVHAYICVSIIQCISPLLHPAAPGKVSIKAQVLGAFLQLVASFLPLEYREKWCVCPGKELSWSSTESASLWRGGREEERKELHGHVYKGTTPLRIHIGTHTPGDVLQCIYYFHQLFLVPCFPYFPPRHGTQARLIEQ